MLAPSKTKRKHFQTRVLLWTESLNCGIELAENFRAKEDSNYAALLDRMRTNEPLLEDIQFINKHVMSAQRPVPGGAFLAAATNKERRAINEQLFYRYLLQNYSTAESSWRARGAIRILANIEEADNGPIIDDRRVQILRNMGDKDLNDRPGYLDIILGHKIMVTHNYDVSKKIANGTIGTVVDVILADDAKVSWHDMRGCLDVGVHTIDAKNTIGIVLRLAGDHQVYHTNLPAGVVVIYPKRYTKQCSWVNRNFKVKVSNYMAVSCLTASTGHKTQGRTLSGGVIMGPPGKLKHNHDGWVYVVMSRVPASDKLYLMEPLPTDMKKYVVRSVIKDEMDRLRKSIFETTVQAIASFCGSRRALTFGGLRDSTPSRRALTFGGLRASSASLQPTPVAAVNSQARLAVTFGALRNSSSSLHNSSTLLRRSLTFGGLRTSSASLQPKPAVKSLARLAVTFGSLRLGKKRYRTFEF